ncbi:MAG: hypothetical protein KGN79_04990 [Acidobacteriota bacterium]|nr:hypothetical protein [Acidobacteriota bacterium]
MTTKNSISGSARGKRESAKQLRWVREHGLSLSFTALFLVCVTGQSIAGHTSYNAELAAHGIHQISYEAYLDTGNFLDGIFVNWQAALLQLTCLVLLGTRLREKGAAHSLTTRKSAERRRKRDGMRRPWVYRNSLTLALGGLFILCLAAHLIFGAMDYNEQMRMVGKPAISTLAFGANSTFWFTTLQTSEAGFAAIAIYVVFSIYLRQQGSPESKPVDSSNEVTGKTNH